MTRLRHLLSAVALAGAAFAAPAAAAYSSLIVFGDSLSDPGNAAALTAGAAPAFPGTPSGTFSNGPTAAQVLAASYGAPTVLGWSNPAPANATNFAVGGARTGSGNYNALVDSPPGLSAAHPQTAATGIAQQIDRYSPASLNAADTLFLVWGGPNDFFYGLAQARAGLPVDFAALTGTAVANLSADIVKLAGLGARNILVPNMPDLGLTPLGLAAPAGVGAQLTLLTHSFNAGLDAALGFDRALLAPLGVNLYSFDSAGLLRGVAAAPAAYGFANATASCVSGGLPALASGCAGYVFFDDVHPTTAAHALLARQFAVAAVPEPATWGLMAAGLALLSLRARRRHG